MIETEHLILTSHGISPDVLESIDTKQILSHLNAARSNGKRAHAPYSKFRVGAALCCNDSPQVFTGCNIENASYGATMCAERVAIFNAVSAGMVDFKWIVLTTLDSAHQAEICMRSPCGLCRQVMSEFFQDDTLIFLDGGTEKSGKDRVDATDMKSMLPWRFRLD